MAGDPEPPVKRAAKARRRLVPLADGDAGQTSAKLNALFRETRAAAGLPPAAEFPIIRECHVGSGRGNALDEVREPLAFKYEAYASWGGASGFVPAERIRAQLRQLRCRPLHHRLGEPGWSSQIGRYGETTGTDHILLRVQWPGLDQKTVVRTLERLGRVVEKLK